MKLARLGLLLLLLPLLAGCMGGGGMPLPADKRADLRMALEEIDRLSPTDLVERQSQLQAQIESVGQPKTAEDREKLEWRLLLAGYCWERRGASEPGALEEAETRYYRRLATSNGLGCGPRSDVYVSSQSPYSSVAIMRIAAIAEYRVEQARAKARESGATSVEIEDALAIEQMQQKIAISALEQATRYTIELDPRTHRLRGPLVLLRQPSVGTLPLQEWYQEDILHEARQRLNNYYRHRLIYRIFEVLVRASGGANRNTSYALAILLLAIAAKLITTPLSASQFRSMKQMQLLQPEIKKLQAKYKDDKQQLAKAQMDLFKEAKINPMSSCLPMLIQMPVLIWVYYGIRYFVYRFEGIHFLYIKSLADPDVVLLGATLFPGPLLLLYGISMYFSQKLIATPATTPEQEQQQKMMAYMMPVMFVFILKSLPAAFILYWFLQNILMTGHQYLMMRSPAVQAMAGTTAKSAPERPKPAGPPPEAIEKLSQGTQRAKKKRKKY